MPARVRFTSAQPAHSASAPSTFSARKLALSLLACTLLASCAGQMAYRDGKDLIAQNRIEEGLQKFKQANTEDPRSPVFRAALSQTKERAIASLLLEAEQLAKSQAELARQRYQRILGIEPNNMRAVEGLQNLDKAGRHSKWLAEALVLQEKKDLVGARAKMALILLENPTHQAASQALRALNEANAAPSLQSQLAVAYRKPINIDFKDASVKQVFDVIARTSGLNILFDKDVRQDQKMSIILKNSTIEAAIHYALMTNQLEQQVMDGNTILIYPNQPAKIKDYQDIVVRSFFLGNAEAKTVANSIKTIVKTRDIVVDEKLNMIVLRDSPEAVKMAEKLVALHDQPEPEVMLEVEILEVKRTRLLELGISWPNNLSLSVLPTTTSISTGTGTGATGTTGTTGTTTTTSSGTLLLSDLRANLNAGRIGAEIGKVTARAGQSDSDVNLLANPRIRARNHEKAKIHIGERVPSVTSTATSIAVSESVNYLDIGLKLEVEPSIFLDNDVAIKISMEVSNIVSEIQTKSGTSAYRIGNRSASTVLRLKDGETQILAGLLNDEDRRSANKIPGIGDFPILGRLFGGNVDANEKTEIILSITPRLIRNIQRPDAALAEFRAGTEGSMRVRPESGGAVTVLPSRNAASAASSAASSQGPSANPAQNNPSTNPGSSNNSSSSGSSFNQPGTSITVPSATGATTNLETGSVAPSPTPPQLQWAGPPTVKVGENLSLQLVMRSDQAIASLPLALSFDNKVLQVTGIQEGDFLKQGGAQTTFTSKIDPSGQILISGTRNGPGGATEAGAIVTINFRALTPSDASRVQLITISPVTANGQGLITALPAPYSLQVRP
jgi:general secretion pathway protein D